MTQRRLCLVIESGTDVRLVEGLAGRFDLTVLARRMVNGEEISQSPQAPVRTILGPSPRLRFATLAWQYLYRERKRIDFVVTQGYGAAALAANLASRITGTTTFMLVCSPVEAYYLCRRRWPELGRPFRLGELWGLQAIARLNAVLGRHYIVLSRYLKDVVRRHGARIPVSIIPLYGVDTEIFRPSNERKTVLRARRGLPTNGSLIFFSSRVAPEKDSETLLLAARRLMGEGRDLWLLHRSGGFRSFLDLAKQMDVANRVIATDAVHPHRDLPGDYQASDLCVQASREEGLGFSPLEALACGVPVVATAVGGLRETIVDGETGWTYPVGDADALARCIGHALDDHEEAARRAAAGRAAVLARYERRLVFDNLAHLIDEALRGRSES